MQANSRARCALWAIALLALVAPAALATTPDELARLKGGALEAHELHVSDGGGVQATFFVAAPPAVARAVLWDTLHFPAFMPGTREAKVLALHGNRQLSEMRGGQGPFTVDLVTERRLGPDRIDWHAAGGDLPRNDGYWAFAAVPGGTLVTYWVHVTPRGPVPGAVVSFLQKQALPNMVRAVRRRIEQVAAGAAPVASPPATSR